MASAVPAKLKVTTVTLVKTDAGYVKFAKSWAEQDEVEKALADPAQWTAQPTKSGGTTIGYPVVDGHPGHIAGSGWQYNAERGNGSNDRIIVAATATVANNAVAITAVLTVVLNKH